MSMTLEQVRDWHRQRETTFRRLGAPDTANEHRDAADAIDAHLTPPAQAAQVDALRWLAMSCDPHKLTGAFAVDHARRAFGMCPFKDDPSYATAEPVAQVVTQSMVHEAMAHVPFGLSFPARCEWIANYLNAAGDDPNKPCECCGVTPAGDIPGDEPVAQPEPADAVSDEGDQLTVLIEHLTKVVEARHARAVPKLDAEDWAVLQRLRNALPDVGLNGWHRGVTVLSKLLAAAPSPGESQS